MQLLCLCSMPWVLVNLMLHVQEASKNLQVGTIFKLVVLPDASLSVLIKGSSECSCCQAYSDLGDLTGKNLREC
ncbi:hypothetical protein EDC04DRAFT_2791818 [Pisolithus marmoratus]|nr:hypothetical protein EDC04DRAFT_2791818 [Pisolithus marmoratus]